MIKIFSPRNEAELTVAKSLLESEDIPYHVKNEHFGSLYPGIAIKYINAKTVYVPLEYKEDAIDILSGFIEDSELDYNDSSQETTTSIDRETGLSGWIKNIIAAFRK